MNKVAKLSRRTEVGFSLLEVLVAFSILAICLGVLMRIFSGDGRLAGLAEEHARAIVHAQSLLARIGVESPIRPGISQGEFEDGFRWHWNISPYQSNDEPLPDGFTFKPYWIEVVVEWGEADDLREFSLQTLRLAGEAAANPMMPAGAGFTR